MGIEGSFMTVRHRRLSLVPMPPADGAGADAEAPPDDPVATVEEAFKRYAPLVASLGLRITALEGEIDDLVQEVFLRATSGIGHLRHQGATKAWLMTITVNVARQRLRLRKLRRVMGLDRPIDYADLIDPDLSPEQRLLVARVYETLERLPVNQRLAWMLRHVEGEALEAVAALCRCSLATVKRRIAAAQKAIDGVVG
jgi:RNA polymerase sigma-70 factor (ECF subfamily)